MTLILPQRGRFTIGSKIQTAYGPFSTSNYLRFSSAPSYTPVTMMAWCTTSGNSSVNETILSMHRNTNDGNNSQMIRKGGNSQTPPTTLQARTRSSSASFADTGSNSFPEDGSWVFAAGVFSASNSRLAYLNGTTGTDTANVTPSSATFINIGKSEAGIASNRQPWVGGYLAHVALWTTDLTTSELDQLYAGASPLDIQSASLLHYLPLTGADPTVNLGSAGSWTEFGTIPSTSDVVGPIYY